MIREHPGHPTLECGGLPPLFSRPSLLARPVSRRNRQAEAASKLAWRKAVGRQERVPTQQSPPFAVRAGLEPPPVMEEDEDNR